MNNRASGTIVLLGIACVAAIGVSVMLAVNWYYPILVPIWIISILLCVLGSVYRSTYTLPSIRASHLTLFICAIILLPSIVRVLNYQPYRIHGDDLLTATFSREFHPLTTNFFAGVPQGTAWVAKFPSPYFFMQKIFLGITGANILTVKLSVIPYILVVSLMTYIIGTMVLGRVAGISGVIIYAFMAISLYHETLGLHFISSTALYMVFFYSLLRCMKQDKPFWYVMSGVTAATCYLSYTSSYIALPVLAFTILLRTLTHKKSSIYRWIIWSLIGYIVTLSPFITYALTQENYFGGRINQVSLLTGSWSASRLTQPSYPVIRDVLLRNTRVAVQSMVYDGIGGHGGYTFNQRAFFHPFGLFLFILGILSLFLREKTRTSGLLILVTIGVSFITGVVLTIPPPAFHRLTLTFPFIAIVSAAPFALISQKHFSSYGVWIVAIALAIFAGVNLHYFQTAVQNETLIEDARVVRYINATYPNRHIHIAAFPSFALEKIIPFFQPYTARSLDTKYHLNYLDRFNTNEPYLYIITLPKDFKDQFQAADPNGVLVPFSDKYMFMVNLKP